MRQLSKGVFIPIGKNFSPTLNRNNHVHSTYLKCSLDLIVIGGGLIGLSTAWEAAKLGAKVTIVVGNETTSATLAAAGMLAPQGERLEQGPLLQLCVSSRELYPAFVEEIERTSGLTTDFSTSGFLCPSFGDDSISNWKPPLEGGYQQWLSKEELQIFEPLLNEKVVGGWWFPQDCHINNKKLYESLKVACQRIGVHFIHSFVDNMIYSNKRLSKLELSTGEFITADRYVIANGCWLRKLVPLPVYPQKGQMISLSNESGIVPLQRVIYGEGVYIVPRKNGEIVLGATVEDKCLVDFQTSAGGICKVLEQTLKLIPSLSQLPLKQTWAGYRPTTPDLLPVFGKLWYDNVSVCTGHHRNGILLAPISGKIASRIALDMKMDDIIVENDVINTFSVERFSHMDISKSKPMDKTEYSKRIVDNRIGIKQSSTSDKEWKNLSKSNEEEEEKETQVKLWQVTDDGSLIPIYYRQPPHDLFSTEGYGDFAEQIPPISRDGQSNNNSNGVFQDSYNGKQSTLEKDISTTEWSRTTDAYLDISSGVDDDNYEKEMRKAILANLQFQVISSEVSPNSNVDKPFTDKTLPSEEEEKAFEKGAKDEYREWLKFYETADTNQNTPC